MVPVTSSDVPEFPVTSRDDSVTLGDSYDGLKVLESTSEIIVVPTIPFVVPDGVISSDDEKLDAEPIKMELVFPDDDSVVRETKSFGIVDPEIGANGACVPEPTIDVLWVNVR